MVFIEQSNLKHILKSRQINQNQKEDIFIKRSHKIWVLHKNDHTNEATDNEIDKKIAHIKPPKCSRRPTGNK